MVGQGICDLVVDLQGALLEAGLVRAKNLINIMMKNLADLSIGTLGFWAVGFGIMFSGNLFEFFPNPDANAYGADPNWGRIMQTVGAEGIAWNPETTRVRVGGVAVFRRGQSAGPAARKRAEKALRAVGAGGRRS